jgi:hypothetical protein
MRLSDVKNKLKRPTNEPMATICISPQPQDTNEEGKKNKL